MLDLNQTPSSSVHSTVTQLILQFCVCIVKETRRWTKRGKRHV